MNRIRGEAARLLKPEDLAEPQFQGDAREDIPIQITEFVTCAACGKERPEDIGEVEWMRLSVGLTLGGLIQVVCIRHNRNVTLFSSRR